MKHTNRLIVLANRFQKIAANKAYEAGFRDGAEDIKLDQWGSPVESWNAFLQHHKRNKTVEEWMHDVKSYKQGYNDSAFTSEKKHEVNKGFWPRGGNIPEHSKKHKPHSEEGETSFEGLLDEDIPLGPHRDQLNAIYRVLKATRGTFTDAAMFVRSVGADKVFEMSFEEIRKALEHLPRKIQSIPDNGQAHDSPYLDSAEGQTISKRRALHELKRHGHGAEVVAEFLKEMGDKDTYDAQEVLRWLGY